LARAFVAAAVLGLWQCGAQAQGIADLFDAKSQKLLGSVGGAWANAGQSGTTGKAALPSSAGGQSAALDILGSLTSNANAAPSNFKYTYNPATSVKVRDHLVKVIVRSVDNVSEKELADGFKEMDVAEKIGTALESMGFTKHSFATALAYWMVINFEIVYGTQFNQKQNTAAVKQMEQRMAATPEIGQLNDETKQFISEGLIWLATLQYMGQQNAIKGAPGAPDLSSVVKGARTALAFFKINPDDFMLTANGLVKR